MKSFWLVPLFLLLLVLGSGVAPKFVMAAGAGTPGGEFSEGLFGEFGVKSFAGDVGLSTKDDAFPIITSIIQWLLALSALLAMGALVWGGIMYIMSLGNETKAEHAKKIIMFAIIGVVVVLMSYAIIAFVQARLTTLNPFGVTTVYAATSTDNGFESGKKVIEDDIAKEGSGLAKKDFDVIAFVIKIVNFLLGLVAVLALAALIWASIMYITSLGDENKTEKAKKIIFYAIGGVLVAGLSFVILKEIQNLITK